MEIPNFILDHSDFLSLNIEKEDDWTVYLNVNNDEMKLSSLINHSPHIQVAVDTVIIRAKEEGYFKWKSHGKS